MDLTLGTVSPDPAFLRGVGEESGQKVASCSHRSKWSNGCPAAFEMDVPLDRDARLVQIRVKDEVLRSSSIWLCASCETCVTRRPNQVVIPAMVDILRQMALREKVPAADPAIEVSHAGSFSWVAKHGRVHDLGTLPTHKVKTRSRMQESSGRCTSAGSSVFFRAGHYKRSRSGRCFARS